MKTSADPRARRRLIILMTTGTALVVLVAFGVYGLLTGPNKSPSGNSTPTSAPSASSAPTPDVSPTPSPPAVPPVRASRDPETFAGNVALALFTWDTTTGLMPLDYTSVLLDVGDHTGTEQAGLAADITSYLPTREAWIDLRQYATTQTLTIDSIQVPNAWNEAVEQAHPGQLPPGAVAYTIHGTRQRDGVWNGAPTSAEREVAFTVFIACPPDETCHLLRLSRLDTPLD